MRKGTVIAIAIIIAFLAIFSNLAILPFEESRHDNYETSVPNDKLPIDDSDNDGMPDDWEIMFGLNPLDASDANLDMDFLPDEWDP